MVMCAVFGCSNNPRNTKHLKTTFHKFPKNLKHRNAWIRAIARANYTPSRNAVICSNHFTSDDFKEPDMAFDIGLNYTTKTTLKKTAVPTVFKSYPKYLIENAKKIRKSLIEEHAIDASKVKILPRIPAIDSEKKKNSEDEDIDDAPVSANDGEVPKSNTVPKSTPIYYVVRDPLPLPEKKKAPTILNFSRKTSSDTKTLPVSDDKDDCEEEILSSPFPVLPLDSSVKRSSDLQRCREEFRRLCRLLNELHRKEDMISKQVLEKQKMKSQLTKCILTLRRSGGDKKWASRMSDISD